MTGLVSPSAPHPDDRAKAHQDASGLALAMVSTAMEQLRGGWCGLGFDGGVFLNGPELQSSLETLQPSQHRDLLMAILGLCEEPRLCTELQRVILLGVIDSSARSSAVRLVVTLQPVLSVQLPRLCTFVDERRISNPTMLLASELGQNIALLGLSLRMENALRRNRLQLISDLIGLGEPQLLGLRGVGAGGLQELRDALDRLGLDFPLLVDPAEAFILPKPLSEAITSNTPSPSWSWSFQPQKPHFDESEDQRWLERATALIDPASYDTSNAKRVLEELSSLTLEHFSTLSHRIEQLHQLRIVFQDIEKGALGDHNRRLLAEGLEGVLLEGYRVRFEAPKRSSEWLRQLQRAVESSRAVESYLRHASGETLQSIGNAANPPVTREAVRNKLRKLTECSGLPPKMLAARMANRRDHCERQRLQDALQRSLECLGRLPFHSDESLPFSDDPFVCSYMEKVRNLSLCRRLAFHAELNLPISVAEWDLHFRELLANEKRPGPGYWDDLEPLRQFLPRFAELINAPGLMPLQTQTPAIIKGAVQRHGGQSAVARAVGLTYQGQLVGEYGGRTYWTEQHLIELLEQTAVHSALTASSMPNRPQITAFLASGVMPEYLDKQPQSVFAALSRQNTLSWEQVAERFNRVLQG